MTDLQKRNEKAHYSSLLIDRGKSGKQTQTHKNRLSPTPHNTITSGLVDSQIKR